MYKKTISFGIALLAMLTLVGASNAEVLGTNSKVRESSILGSSDLPTIPSYYFETQAVAEALTSGNFDSFAGVVPDSDSGVVDLYLIETPDARMDEYLSSVLDVKIRVHKAKYSHRELEAGIKLISDEVLRSLKEGVDVYSAHASDDGTAIELTLRAGSAPPSTEWLRHLTEISGVAVKVNVSVDEVPDSLFALQTRTTPTDPWLGGSLFIAGGFACSTGFGVTSDLTDLDYIITARHCFNSSSNLSLQSYGGANYMGSWSPSQYYNYINVDTSLTFPSGQGASNKVFTGAYNSDADSAKIISGVGTNTLNKLVCVNGANSGAHCEVRVIQTPATVFSNGQSLSGVVTGRRDNNSVVGAHGDSGGPVVGLYSSSGFVFGYGIVHSGFDIGQCSQLNTPTNIPGTICGNEVTWIDLATLLSASHMSLK